jgi:hypothetical protein
MPENAEALAYYYHLRSQGVDPISARLHVRLRFGIIINGDLPAADEVTTPVREPMEFGGDFPETVWGTSTGPQYGRAGDYCECCDPDEIFCRNRRGV